jgi:hypothetical protein
MPTPHIFGQDEQFGPPIVRYQGAYNQYVNNLQEYGAIGPDLINVVARFISQGDNRRFQNVRRNIYTGLAAAGINTASLTYNVLSTTLRWVANAIAYRANDNEDMDTARQFVEATKDKDLYQETKRLRGTF